MILDILMEYQKSYGMHWKGLIEILSELFQQFLESYGCCLKVKEFFFKDTCTNLALCWRWIWAEEVMRSPDFALAALRLQTCSTSQVLQNLASSLMLVTKCV